MVELYLATLAVIVFTVTDIWTTNKVLGLGGSEKNPIIRYAMKLWPEAWWAFKLALMGIFLWIAHTIAETRLMAGETLLWVGAFALCAVSYYNYRRWKNMEG